MGKPNSYSEEEGEIVEKKEINLQLENMVNPGDEEDFTCQENLIESYLVEEMLGFKEEEEEETPRSTGESDETTKPKKTI